MKIKELTKQEEEKRKYKKYNLLSAYTCEKGENKIDISKAVYDKYVVCSYSKEILTKIDIKKEKNNIVFEVPKKGEYVLYGKDKNRASNNSECSLLI